MTDRDTFAAAALAGLLSRNHAVGERDHCCAAYQWADAMLRERERKNHDAAPAARAVSDEDRTDKAATSHRRDRPGDTPVAESATTAEPVAWAAIGFTGKIEFGSDLKSEAEEYAEAGIPKLQVVPLYRQPTLTDAERAAIRDAIAAVDWHKAFFCHLSVGEPLPSASLRKLLERLGGGK